MSPRIIVFATLSLLGHAGLLVFHAPDNAQASTSWETGETSLLVNFADPATASSEASSQPPAPTVRPAEPEPEPTDIDEPAPNVVATTSESDHQTTKAQSTPDSQTLQPVVQKSKHRIEKPQPERTKARQAASRRAAMTKSPARIIRNPAPPYPRAARKRNREGRVVLQVRVDPSGRPGSVRVARSSGYSPFDEAALSTVKRSWRFAPARQGDRTVSSTEYITINFQLR